MTSLSPTVEETVKGTVEGTVETSEMRRIRRRLSSARAARSSTSLASAASRRRRTSSRRRARSAARRASTGGTSNVARAPIRGRSDGAADGPRHGRRPLNGPSARMPIVSAGRESASVPDSDAETAAGRRLARTATRTGRGFGFGSTPYANLARSFFFFAAETSSGSAGGDAATRRRSRRDRLSAVNTTRIDRGDEIGGTIGGEAAARSEASAAGLATSKGAVSGAVPGASSGAVTRGDASPPSASAVASAPKLDVRFHPRDASCARRRGASAAVRRRA